MSNTTCLSIEESGETHIKETVKQSLRDKVLGDNKSVLRQCLELNGMAFTETRVIGQIKIEELSPVQDTCIIHKDHIASPGGSDTSYYETSDTSDCSTDTKTASLTSDTVYRQSSNEYSDISPPSSPCEPPKKKAKLDLQHVSVKLERLPPSFISRHTKQNSVEESPKVVLCFPNMTRIKVNLVSTDIGKITRPTSLTLSKTFCPSTPLTTRSKRKQNMPTKSPESLPSLSDYEVNSITSVMESPLFSPLNSPFKQAEKYMFRPVSPPLNMSRSQLISLLIQLQKTKHINTTPPNKIYAVVVLYDISC